MPAMPFLVVLGCLMPGMRIGTEPVAPVPKETPMLKCVLTLTGKIPAMVVPDGGEVVVTNTSTEVVDIGSAVGPGGFLELKVKDPKGVEVKTTPFLSRLSPHSPTPQPYLLKPGESYRRPVTLLGMVPVEKRVPGTYTVKAVFTFKKKDYESPEVEVKWKGKE